MNQTRKGARRGGPAAAIQLSYPGKDMSDQILPAAPNATLVVVKRYGDVAAQNAGRLIHGDNATCLRVLRDDPQVAGQITVAYIDPPFATGNDFHAGKRRTATISKAGTDELAYSDRLAPAEYLEFLRTRLILIRELLSSRGSIWVHIGHQMSHYVRVLLDEVFGSENFLNEITRVKCNPKNFSRRAFGNVKDTLLFYSRSGRHVWNESREEMSEEALRRLFPRVDGEGRRYTTTPLHAPGETRNGRTGRHWRNMLPPEGRHWRYDPAELDRLDGAGLIEWSKTGNPRKIVYSEDVRRAGKKRQDIWTFKDPIYPSYPTEKNLDLLETIVSSCSDPGELVLDCFCGSGTTLAAAAKLGRRWIGMDASGVAVKNCAHRLSSLPVPFTVEKLRCR